LQGELSKRRFYCEVFTIGDSDKKAEQTGILQDAVRSFLAGGMEEDGIQQIIDETIEELAEMRGIFRTNLSGQAPQLRDYCNDEVAAVELGFDEYEKALLSLKDAVRDRDLSSIESIGAAVSELTSRLNTGFLRFRETVLWAAGPTNHSGINILLSLIGKILAGVETEESVGRLDCEAGRELRMAEGMVAALETGKSFPEYAMKDFYISYRDLLGEMREALRAFFHFERDDGPAVQPEEEQGDREAAASDESREGSLEAPQDIRVVFGEYACRLEELAAEYDRNDLLSHVRALSAEPTGIPFVNVLFNTARRVLGGGTSSEVLDYFLLEFEAALEAYALKHAEIMKFETRSASIAELGAHMGSLLEKMGTITAEYRLFAQQPSAELLESCEAHIWPVAMELQQTIEALRAYSESETSVMCICCGTENKVGSTTCTECKAVLSTAGLDAPSLLNTVMCEPGNARPPEEPKMTRNIQSLFDGAERYIDGSMTRQEFESVIAGIERLFSLAEKTSREMPDKAHQQDRSDPMMDEAADKYRSGLQHFGRGLSLLKSLAETGNQRILDEAKSEILEGAGLLQSMQRLLEPRIRNMGSSADESR